jgi:hypothetical protein
MTLKYMFVAELLPALWKRASESAIAFVHYTDVISQRSFLDYGSSSQHHLRSMINRPQKLRTDFKQTPQPSTSHAHSRPDSPPRLCFFGKGSLSVELSPAAPRAS